MRTLGLQVRAVSKFSHLPGWRLVPIIVKSNDDLRQEQFVSQLMKQIHKSFQRERVPVWLASYGACSLVRCRGMCPYVLCVHLSVSERSRCVLSVYDIDCRHSRNDACGGTHSSRTEHNVVGLIEEEGLGVLDAGRFL